MQLPMQLNFPLFSPTNGGTAPTRQTSLDDPCLGNRTKPSALSERLMAVSICLPPSGHPEAYPPSGRMPR